MSGATSPTKWTYEEYARLPDDGNRYEVLDGEVLVTPSPGTSHQRTASRLFTQLWEYVRAQGLGEMVWDLDLLFVSGQYLRPDMMYVPKAERSRLVERGMEGTPGLVVEIVSTSSVRIDRVRKPARYADFGVPEYWAVDPGHKGIWIWEFDKAAVEPRLGTERVVWQPDPAVPPLRLEIPLLFEAP